MGKYNVHAGHNYKVPGAGGCFSETSEDRNVKNAVISYLRAQGHTVYDCTDEDGATEGANLQNIVNKCNSHNVDVDVSIHFNAFNGSAHGTEVWVYPGGGCDGIAQRIVNNLVGLGYANRGVKSSSQLYVLNSTSAPALLVEVCFCDSGTDASIYNCDKAARAIVQGLTGQAVSGSASSGGTTTTTTNLYRIRKSWADAKSQIGAYKSLDGAKSACVAGYTVYDWNGKAVYSNVPQTPSTNTNLYRVRKTWADAKSQTGAYASLDNAKKSCGVGYSVFDANGKVVYTNSGTTTTPTTPTEPDKEPETPVTPEAPEAVDISPLKGVDNDTFLSVVGSKAKADMLKTGVLASVTIAQAILESAWGQSDLSLKANNLFGMKAGLSGNNWGSEWGGATVTKNSPEEKDGVVSMVLSTFRKFDSIDECIKDHSKYLSCAMNGAVLRYDGIIGERDYRKAITIAKNGGYATDSGYVDKICGLIEQYELTRFDKLEEVEENPTAPPVEDVEEGVDISTITSVLTKILDLLQKLVDFFTRK